MAQASSSSATTRNFRNRKANINKLSNTNYRVWSSKMIILFRQTKLWSVVQGIEAKPDVRDPTFEALEEKDLVAQLEIMSHLDDQQFSTIRKFETSHEMWTDLRNEFEPKTHGNQVMTLDILVTLKIKNDDEIVEFINTWKRNLMIVLQQESISTKNFNDCYFSLPCRILGVTLLPLKMQIII